MDHVVRRSLPEESGRRREKLCQLRSAIVADNRRSVWETALPWEAEMIRPPSARTRAGQGGNGYPVVLTRVQRGRFQRDGFCTKKVRASGRTTPTIDDRPLSADPRSRPA